MIGLVILTIALLAFTLWLYHNSSAIGEPMRRIAMFLSIALMLVTASTAFATKPDSDGQHQVWVCKYVGQPGDFEIPKPGKQPIIVDVAAADAYVGADFADGQNHSLVIDLATNENTGQGERYTGDATCPTPDPTTIPTSIPTITPEPSVTPTPIPTETVSPTTTPSPVPTSSDPSPDPSSTTSPTFTSQPEPTTTTSSPEPTLPPTDAASDGGVQLNAAWVTLIIAAVSFILLLATPQRKR